MVLVLFGQLFAAGRTQATAAAVAGKAIAQIDDAVRAEKLARQEQVVAAGTPRDVLESVMRCMCSTAGVSFIEKMAGYRKSAIKSLSSQLSVQTIAPADGGSGFTVETSDGTATYHVTMQVRCVFECGHAKGFADYLATGTLAVKKCFRAVTARKFSSTDWSFALLTPELPGRPPSAELKAAMRDVEDGRINGSSTCYQTAAEDAQHHPWMLLGMCALVAAEGPNFDDRFLGALMRIKEGITRWQIVGVPLSQVCRCLVKLMSLAERQANAIAVGVGGSVGRDDSVFTTDSEFERVALEMDACSRAAQVSQASIWLRQAELAGWEKERPEDKITQQEIDAAVAAALKEQGGYSSYGGDGGRRNRDRRKPRNRNRNGRNGGRNEGGSGSDGNNGGWFGGGNSDGDGGGYEGGSGGGGHGGGSGGGTGGGGNDGGWSDGGNSEGAEEAGHGSDGNGGGCGGGSGGGAGGGGNDGGWSDSGNSEGAEEAGSGSEGDSGGSGGSSPDLNASDCTEDNGSGSYDDADSSGSDDEDSGYVSPAAMQINSSQWLRADSGYVSPDEDE
jgi:hypothetical protein